MKMQFTEVSYGKFVDVVAETSTTEHLLHISGSSSELSPQSLSLSQKCRELMQRYSSPGQRILPSSQSDNAIYKQGHHHSGDQVRDDLGEDLARCAQSVLADLQPLGFG